MSQQALHAKRSILCAVLLSITPLVAQTTATITEFPNIPGNPVAITSGPDGALWFAGKGIGRISTTGAVTTPGSTTGTCVPGFGCTGGGPVANLQASGIVTGPDGALWFTNAASPPSIGRITTAGVATQFSTPTSNVPAQIAAGADGNLWYTLFNPGYPTAAPKLIYRMTTAGVFTSFATSGNPIGITKGPDGAIWFTEASVSYTPSGVTSFLNGAWIGRIDGSGSLTEFPLTSLVTNPPVANSGILAPGSITTGPDGALWFTNRNSVWRVTTTGAVTTFPTPGNCPVAITAGSDGALWFTDCANNQIVRITTAGVISAYPTPTTGSSPGPITAGPDGNLWFVELVGGNIGRLTPSTTVPPGQLQITTSPTLPAGTVGTPYSQTLTAAGGTPPYTWSVTSGTVPAGLTFTNAGAISGTPTAQGTQSLTIQVTDAVAATATASLSLTINPIGVGNCTYVLRDANGNAIQGAITLPPSGGGDTQFVVATAAGCAWTVTGAPSWVSIPVASGTGTGPFDLFAQPNYGPNPRTGTINVGGITVSLTEQSGLISSTGFMPHLAAEGGWTTTFTLVNKGSFAADTQFNLSDNNGNLLPLPLTFPQQPSGPVTEALFAQTINPNASLVVQASGPANIPYVEGSARMTSSGAVDGFAIFHFNPSGQEAVVPLTSIVFNTGFGIGVGAIIPFDNTNGVLTGIAVQNAGQNSPFPVILRDDTGARIGTGNETVTVAPGGHTSFVLSTQFPATTNIRGTIEFLGSQCPPGLSPGACLAASRPYYPAVLAIRYTPPGTLTTVPPLPEFGGGPVGGMFPHIAAGNGWQTTFVLVNNSGTTQQPQLNFFDNTGNPLPVPLTVLQTGGSTTTSSLTLSVPPNASRWVQTTASAASALLTGSAQLSAGVSGFAIYRYNPNGQEAVVSLETRNAGSYLIAFDNTGGTNTGIAVSLSSSQPSGTPIGVPVLVRDDTGNQIAAATLPIASNGHLSQGLTTLFPTTSNIRGTIEFDTPTGASLSVLGIRSPPALTFTTLPALAR